MIQLTVDEAARVMGAEATSPSRPEAGAMTLLPSVSTDTRTLEQGQCFVALRGPRFDGHQFIAEALGKGAAVIVHSQPVSATRDWPARTFLRVQDTTVALQVLAHHVRRRWGKPLIAITGSTGKTTTREFTTTLLSQSLEVLQTPGNLNNQLGLPLSLLRLEDQHEVAVIELGMNHAGEIRSLARIAAPDAALITNVAPVHLEFFASLDEIAAAKAEVLEFLNPKGTFFFNADDPRLCRLAQTCSTETFGFALEKPADVRICRHRLTGLQSMEFTLESGHWSLDAAVPFVGKHFLYDIAAASAVAVKLELSQGAIAQGLALLKPVAMRGRVLQLPGRNGVPVTVWDDSYNSNPDALRMVLETVQQLPNFRRKVLALGDMLELGQTAPELHRQMGRCAAFSGADLLVTVGSHSLHLCQGAREAGFPAAKTLHFDDSHQAAEFLAQEIKAGDFLLVKGSRGIRMDRIVQQIEQRT